MAFVNGNKSKALEMIVNEYKQACEDWGIAYCSPHEGWAVLKEEIEEVEEHFKDLNKGLELLWSSVRGGSQPPQDYMKWLGDQVVYGILELAQVGAVLEKLNNTFRGGKYGEDDKVKEDEGV